MAKFEVKNSEGKKVAEAELAAEVYGIEPSGVTVALSSPPSPVPTLSV